MSIDVISTAGTLEGYIKEKIKERDEQQAEDAFRVCDVTAIIRKHLTWCQLLPRVKPFYAIKCNDDVTTLRVLKNLGVNFDCASRNEIQSVLDIGVSPDRIIYAHPCKQMSYLKYAADSGVQLMTFDNLSELHKIKKHFPEARLVIRISSGLFKARVVLSNKFGCSLGEVPALLQEARRLNLNIVGVSFHVGSDCMCMDAFPTSIAACRRVFDMAETMGMTMSILDLGGGYPGLDDKDINFEKIAKVINMSLEEHFPEGCGVDIIAEPGRYYVQDSATLLVNVIGRKSCNHEMDKTEGESDANETHLQNFVINDSIFGSFMCDVGFDHLDLHPRPIKRRGKGKLYPTVLWGWSNFQVDRVTENPVYMPELRTGDWICFETFGAYTLTYGLISRPEVFYCVEHEYMHWINNESMKTIPAENVTTSNGSDVLEHRNGRNGSKYFEIGITREISLDSNST